MAATKSVNKKEFSKADDGELSKRQDDAESKKGGADQSTTKSP